MSIRARNLNKRRALSANVQAWLNGDKSCGFFQFKPQAELEALWTTYGDHDGMFWRSRYDLPITHEELAEHEEAWLASGEDDGYFGMAGSFIQHNYTAPEKAVLWNETR
jgi:hypothetical protein